MKSCLHLFVIKAVGTKIKQFDLSTYYDGTKFQNSIEWKDSENYTTVEGSIQLIKPHLEGNWIISIETSDEYSLWFKQLGNYTTCLLIYMEIYTYLPSV